MGRLDDVQAAKGFDPGKTLSESLSIYFRNFAGFTTLAIIVNVPVLLVLAWLVAKDMDFTTQQGVDEANSALKIVGWIDSAAALILHPILTAALIYGVVQELRGSPANLGDAISVGFKRMLPALGVGLGVGVMAGLGFVACIVPGFWFLSTYWLAVPVAVLETGHKSSFDRSKALTEKLRWKVFSVIFVTMLVQFGVNFAITKMIGSDTPANVKAQHILLAVSGILGGVWNATTAAVGYYQIRRLKEGIDIAEMAAVFD